MRAPFVLATDLDGTFAHGTAAARERLLAWLGGHPAATLVYVTGRTPEAVRELAERTPLPVPDVLVADVGTSVLHGLGPDRVVPIEAELDALWPGADVVRERLAPVPGVVEQEVRAPRRVSYWIEAMRRPRAAATAASDTLAPRDASAPSGATAAADPSATTAYTDPFAARGPGDPSLDARAEALAAEVAERVRSALGSLPVEVVVPANVFLDVLPQGVNKGSTLRRVLAWLGAADEACVVAGDSLNDLALFDTGMRGIAVGNCEPALRRRLEGRKDVFLATGEGVDGVVEGLLHHGYLSDAREPGDGHGQ